MPFVAEDLHTTTAWGELLPNILGALAPYERALTRERVMAGLAAARHRGRLSGQPAAIPGGKPDTVPAALNDAMSKAAVCGNCVFKRTTLLETLPRIVEPNLASTSDVAA